MMEEIESNNGLSIDSIQTIANNMDIFNLNNDAAKLISDSASYQLKIVLKVSKYVFRLF